MAGRAGGDDASSSAREGRRRRLATMGKKYRQRRETTAIWAFRGVGCRRRQLIVMGKKCTDGEEEISAEGRDDGDLGIWGVGCIRDWGALASTG